MVRHDCGNESGKNGRRRMLMTYIIGRDHVVIRSDDLDNEIKVQSRQPTAGLTER